MATYEFKIDEAKAFWIAGSNLRRAVREGGEIDALTKLVEDHARYGIQPGVKARAEALLGERRRSTKAG